MSSSQQVNSGADVLDAVVVGAGWAGLGVSYWLAQKRLRHSVLERGRVAETWRTQRWNAFRMNTPNVQTVMPGDRYEGPDPEGFLPRDQFIALLEDFAARNALPIEADTAVSELVREDGVYRLTTSQGTRRARNVVVASGDLNNAVRPPWSAAVSPDIYQVDASGYRSAADLPAGAVLVVGNGQSGSQIAEELAAAGRKVFLATSRVGLLPRRYRGRDVVIWLDESGFLDVRREEIIRLAGRIPPRGINVSLEALGVMGIVLLGRVTGVTDGGRLSFSDDVEANLRFANEAADKAKRYIDEYIDRAGIDAPASEPDPAETVAWRPPVPAIASLDPHEAGIASIVWCTGFKGDYSYVKIPGALDAAGKPLHTDGVGALPGLYFAGLDFASTRKSGIILGIAEEAPRLVGHIVMRS